MLGTRLRQARLAAGLSLEGLAAKLEHPISKQALSKYEKGTGSAESDTDLRHRAGAQRDGVVAAH